MLKTVLIWLMLIVAVGFYALEGSDIFGPVAIDTVDPELTLIAPCGGEIWTSGTTQQIRWVAYDNHFDANPIDISYSADGFMITVLFDSIPNSESIGWSIPYLSSNAVSVYIRAKDQFGNTSRDQSSACFHITEPKLSSPDEFSINVVSESDILLTWAPVSQFVDGYPASPDGYIVLYSSVPTYNLADYSVLGYCSGTSYIHENAIQTRPKGYYVVLAYKDQGFGVPFSSQSNPDSSPHEASLLEPHTWRRNPKDGR